MAIWIVLGWMMLVSLLARIMIRRGKEEHWFVGSVLLANMIYMFAGLLGMEGPVGPLTPALFLAPMVTLGPRWIFRDLVSERPAGRFAHRRR